MNSLISLAQSEGGFWLPPARSTFAQMTDDHFFFVYWVSVFFFVVVVGLMFYFMFRYTKPAGTPAESHVDHNLPLEIVWTGIPCILVVYMFWIGFTGYIELSTPPTDGYGVNVEASRWSWAFRYPENGAEASGANEELNQILASSAGRDEQEKQIAALFEKEGLHLPPGVPINLTLSSTDVLHAFYTPDFRTKLDIVPGRLRKLWFEPTEPGVYALYCAEYCGTDHSRMRSRVVVHETQEGFDAWLAKAGSYDLTRPWSELGEKVYKRKGCSSCHTTDGSAKTGPTWKDLWGSQREYSEGGTTGSALASEDYVLESIRNPMKKIAAGFKGQMPIKKISDEEILFLIEYMKTLSTHKGGG